MAEPGNATVGDALIFLVRRLTWAVVFLAALAALSVGVWSWDQSYRKSYTASMEANLACEERALSHATAAKKLAAGMQAAKRLMSDEAWQELTRMVDTLPPGFVIEPEWQPPDPPDRLLSDEELLRMEPEAK